jgi:hypothetical protein
VPQGELIFANVLDVGQRAAEGEMANGVVQLVALGARALPFAIIRDWKAPTGYLSEEVELLAPSSAVAYRLGPLASYMLGQMDVTRLENVVEDAMLGEVGTYVASFLLEGEVVGQTEFQVAVRPTPAKLPGSFEDGLKRTDVLWVGVESNGRDRAVPVWFVYRNGKILLLSAKEPGPAEQSIPGIPGADELVVISRRKLRDTALERFRASARLLEGDEWEEAAKALADRRRDRHGPPGDAIERWRDTCVIAELTPIVPA